MRGEALPAGPHHPAFSRALFHVPVDLAATRPDYAEHAVDLRDLALGGPARRRQSPTRAVNLHSVNYQRHDEETNKEGGRQPDWLGEAEQMGGEMPRLNRPWKQERRGHFHVHVVSISKHTANTAFGANTRGR